VDDHEVMLGGQLTRVNGACSHLDGRLQGRVCFQGQFGDSPNRGPLNIAERNLTDRRCHRIQNLGGFRAGAGRGARKLLWTQPERYVKRLAM
jgi:hypothetical protein